MQTLENIHMKEKYKRLTNWNLENLLVTYMYGDKL